jgi:hypothetical protein
MEIISRHLSVRTEENYEKPQVRIAVVSIQIRNKNLWNRGLQPYRYTDLVGLYVSMYDSLNVGRILMLSLLKSLSVICPKIWCSKNTKSKQNGDLLENGSSAEQQPIPFPR